MMLHVSNSVRIVKQYFMVLEDPIFNLHHQILNFAYSIQPKQTDLLVLWLLHEAIESKLEAIDKKEG